MGNMLQIKNEIQITMGMTTKKSILLLLMLCTGAISFSQDDFGIWYGITGEVKLVKNLELDLTGNVRTFNKASKIDQAFLEAGVTYKFNKYLAAGTSYRFTEFLENNGAYYPRHKWFADLKGKLPLGRIELSARLRFQERFKTYFKDEQDKIADKHGRFRFKALYNIPSFPVNPYIASEIFFPLFTQTARGIDKDRFMVGLQYNISKKHSLELEYMFQRDFLPHISDINIVSINYDFNF
jgi:predicted porin